MMTAISKVQDVLENYKSAVYEKDVDFIHTTQFKSQRKMQDKSYPAFFIALIYFIYWT